MDPEKASRLQEGITLVLSRWTALQMAVQNEWGGPHSRFKSEQLAADIFSWLTQSKELYADDLEDVLDEFMLSLNTEIADGSIEEIAEKLMIMHEECLEGNFKSLQVLKEANPPNGTVSCIRQGGSDDEDDDNDDDESAREEDALEHQPHVNEDDMAVDEPRVDEKSNTEDGWTVVPSRRNRGKRN